MAKTEWIEWIKCNVLEIIILILVVLLVINAYTLPSAKEVQVQGEGAQQLQEGLQEGVEGVTPPSEAERPAEGVVTEEELPE